LTSLLEMNREEKEHYVIRLYKENKSTREIAKLMHMSFRDIGIVIKKAKMEANLEKSPLEVDDIKSKSKTTQALKLFSELESPVEVAIALDLPVDQVRTIYREYWELEGMHRLTQIYEAKYDVSDLLRLHKMVKDLGMEKRDIINVLDIVKNNQLETLQSKVDTLRDEIKMWEIEKTKYMHRIAGYEKAINELHSSFLQKRDMALKQESAND
jgi:transposase